MKKNSSFLFFFLFFFWHKSSKQNEFHLKIECNKYKVYFLQLRFFLLAFFLRPFFILSCPSAHILGWRGGGFVFLWVSSWPLLAWRGKRPGWRFKRPAAGCSHRVRSKASPSKPPKCLFVAVVLLVLRRRRAFLPADVEAQPLTPPLSCLKCSPSSCCLARCGTEQPPHETTPLTRWLSLSLPPQPTNER